METKPEDWRSSWESRKFKISFGGEVGIDEGGLTKEWLHLVLESVVMREKNEDQGGLKCLKFLWQTMAIHPGVLTGFLATNKHICKGL